MTTKHRLTKLETAAGADKTQPPAKPYVSVSSVDEITPALLASRVKIYVGVNPDDWPD